MDRRDFWKLGPVWVWKWLVLGGILTLSLTVLAVFGLPRWFFSSRGEEPPTYRYDDPKLRELTGAVRILDERGTVRYRGEVDAGSFTGNGQVFDEEGELVYDGPLLDGVREGAGAKVYQDGKLVYEGEMAQDLYEGQGRRTDPVSGGVSEGAFSGGRLEGEGLERSSDGALLREGTFSGDLLNGPGREYGPDGLLLREGTFEDGLLHGEGTQYVQSGALQYQGEFRRGVFHGQGRLYDISLGTLRYEGEFADGVPVGRGRIYHPGGQMLYEGAVSEGRPQAVAFLGLTLAEVEAAFTEHWLLYYAQDGSAAFVYPEFQLMFWTDGPVRISSSARQKAQEEQERQELLDALTTPVIIGGMEPLPEDEPSETFIEPEEVSLSEPLPMDFALAPDTDKGELVIQTVLSYGPPLAGTAQPGAEASVRTDAAGWREHFSDFAAGTWAGAPPAVRVGPFVYEFPDFAEVDAPVVECLLAQQGGVESSTVYREGEKGVLWYQSAERGEEEP